MKKVIALSAFALLVVSSLSSCKKDYECKNSDGTVISTCESCGSTTKSAFDTSCSLAGGTVSEM